MENNNNNDILSKTPFTKCPFCGSSHLEGSSTPEGYTISCANCHEIIDESLSDSAVDILFGVNDDFDDLNDPNDPNITDYPNEEDYDCDGDCIDCKLE